MSIIRGPRPEGNFYILDKKISEDKRLSWASRGLLIYLLGKPNHWQVSVQALVNDTKASTKPTGRDATWSLLRELIDAGYCTRHQFRKADGTLGEMDYTISEDSINHPLTDSPCTAYPGTDEPGTANPTQVSIEAKQGLNGDKKGLSSADAPPLAIPSDLLNDWIAVRKAKKAGPLTNTAIAGLRREADKAGISVDAAVTACCEFGWQGFNAQWYAERTAGRPAAAMTASNRSESFAERDARNKREAWELMTGRQWPADELPGARPAAPFVIDIEANEPRRIS